MNCLDMQFNRRRKCRCRFWPIPFVASLDGTSDADRVARRPYQRANTTLRSRQMRSTSRALTNPQRAVALLAVAAIVAAPTSGHAQATGEAQGAWGGKTNGQGHYADINGLKLYYEIHGAGRPLILLHGGLGALEMFGPNLTALAKGHQVIALDLQGHGRTADIDRPISVELMADDVAGLIRYLKLDRPDVMGYS